MVNIDLSKYISRAGNHTMAVVAFGAGRNDSPPSAVEYSRLAVVETVENDAGGITYNINTTDGGLTVENGTYNITTAKGA